MGDFIKVEEVDDKVVVLTFDVPGQKVNTFSQPALANLAEVLDELEKRSDLRGLLFRSGKPGQFIAGADINEILALAYLEKDQIESVLEPGHSAFTRLSNLPFPTVALIAGPSMGGGTEMALSMDYRIAADSPKTKIGLPEVKLGIIPAWGGTQRMPRLIGVQNALKLICGGEPVGTDEARKLELIFDAVPEDRLMEEGLRILAYANETGDYRKDREQRRGPIGLDNDEMMFMFMTMQGYLFGQTKGQYPAPMVAMEAVRDGCNLPLDQALEVEKKAAKQVMGSTISANLISIFFNDQRLAKDPGVNDASIKPREIRNVGVLGAGLMGAGIAAAHARTSIATSMVDIKEEFVAKGLEAASNVVMGRLKIGRATPQDLATMLGHLNATTDNTAFGAADLVIEAITENEEVKKKVYANFKEILKGDAILASNTSTISITRLAEASPDPSRFVGMHFFNPVDRMKLDEVIRGEKTSDETVATIVALSKKIKKTPIVCNDCAGFLVNRCLLPYMAEALLLLLEGATMDDIDKASTKFGMPMGPIALQDLVGIDTSCFAGKVLEAAYSDRAVKSGLLDDMVAANRLGKKTGKGFRQYVGPKGKPAPDPEVEPILAKHRISERKIEKDEIADRMFLTMLLEASRAFEEGIVREPGDVDMGLILGTGFPPFRGGILRWCDTEGAGNILARAEKYRELGARFEPTETLRRMASSDEKFYPRPKTIG